MKRIFLASLAFCILLVMSFPLTAHGADYTGKVRKANYVAAKAGIYFPGSDLDRLGFENGFSAEAAYGIYINRNFVVEFGVGLFLADGSAAAVYNGGAPIIINGPVVSSDVVVVPVTVTAKGIIPIEVGEAYVGAGAGLYFVRLEQGRYDDEDVVIGGHIVGGANIDISDNAFVGLEAKWIFTDDAELLGSDVELSGVTLTGNFGLRF